MSSFMFSIDSVIDTDKYPIHLLNSVECNQLIEKCRAQLVEVGSVSLPGFIRDSVIEQMVSEVHQLLIIA